MRASCQAASRSRRGRVFRSFLLVGFVSSPCFAPGTRFRTAGRSSKFPGRTRDQLLSVSAEPNTRCRMRRSACLTVSEAPNLWGRSARDPRPARAPHLRLRDLRSPCGLSAPCGLRTSHLSSRAGFQLRPFREFTVLHVLPQRHQQLPRQRHDPHPPVALPHRPKALLIPHAQLRVRLVAQPTPR